MPDPDLTRVRELAAQLRAELERLTRATPRDAELSALARQARELAGAAESHAAARGIIEPPYPNAAPRDPDAG